VSRMGVCHDPSTCTLSARSDAHADWGIDDDDCGSDTATSFASSCGDAADGDEKAGAGGIISRWKSIVFKR
jgi:hypothetical protein